MAIPLLIASVLALIAPEYISQFISSGMLGYAMIGVALVMFAVGGFWMSQVIKIRF